MILIERRCRDQVGHQVHRTLMQHAAGRPVGIALDPPVGRVWRVLGDPGEFQRPRVDPGAVVIAVGEVRGTIRDTTESRLVRCGRPPGNADICQQAPVTQALSGLLGGVGADPLEVLGFSVVRGEIARQHHSATLYRVDVRILKTWDQQPSGSSTTSVSGPIEVIDLCFRPRRSGRLNGHGIGDWSLP